MTNFTVQTCSFIHASQIFENFTQMWDKFCENDPNCSWGDNNRSMITKNVIEEALMHEDIPEDFQRVLDSIDTNMYIDLEN